jgi:cytochrome c oxidase subunit 2
MIEAFLPAVSTYASDIDDLIMLIGAFVGVWFVACYVVLFWFLWKYRARDGHRAEYVTGELWEHKRFITIPHLLVLVCDVFIIYGAVRVWVNVKQTLPPAEATIRVIGQQWAWTFIHQGPDGKFETADDIATIDELHVEKDKTYHFELASRDVLHSFSIPVFRLKQDAIPGRIIKGWFQATKTGNYSVQCAEICGIGHGLMGARIIIETPAQHAAWLTGQKPVGLLAAR